MPWNGPARADGPALRRVRHVGTRHEQGAGYAADGYARSTGRPGVAVVTSGPAVLNAAAAIGQAYSDSVPVLLVSPGMPLRHPGFGNGLLHETKDQSAALAAIAAAGIRATSVAEIPVAVAQAFATMTAGRPRPVHLEVPLDVLGETGEASVAPPVPHPVRVAAAAQIAAAAGRLGTAGHVTIIAGGGARGAAEEVRLLAERLSAAVVTTTNERGVLAADHPLAVGAGIHLPAVRDLVDASDVVLAVGTELAPSDLWNGPLPLAGRLVRVDIDPVAVLTNAVPDVPLVGDAAACLRELWKRVPERAREDTTAYWRERREADGRAEGREWLPIVDALASALPRDAVVAGDRAMVCCYGALANLPAYAPASFLHPTGYGTLGYGLPATIGAKVGNPDRPVVALVGDGGVMFTVAELAAAATLGIALPVVVVDNGGYGEIRNEIADRADPVHAVTLPSPDCAALARSLGCQGIAVDDVDPSSRVPSPPRSRPIGRR